jgi:hypothetical protein
MTVSRSVTALRNIVPKAWLTGPFRISGNIRRFGGLGRFSGGVDYNTLMERPDDRQLYRKPRYRAQYERV